MNGYTRILGVELPTRYLVGIAATVVAVLVLLVGGRGGSDKDQTSSATTTTASTTTAPPPAGESPITIKQRTAADLVIRADWVKKGSSQYADHHDARPVDLVRRPQVPARDHHDGEGGQERHQFEHRWFGQLRFWRYWFGQHRDRRLTCSDPTRSVSCSAGTDSRPASPWAKISWPTPRWSSGSPSRPAWALATRWSRSAPALAP